VSEGIELADPERGLAVALRSGAAVAFDHEDVLAAGPAGAQPFELDVELSELGPAVKLEGELLGSEDLALCRAIGSLRIGDDTREIACLGIRTDGEEPGGEAIERRRSLAVAFSDGALLALSAVLPAGAEGHDEEELAAALVEPEGESLDIGEALLSTSFDADGRQRRATIELWPSAEAEPARRIGGAIVCGASVDLGELRLDTAFFRWSMEGRPGLGRYEVLRKT